MPGISLRKRRRSQAFPSEDEMDIEPPMQSADGGNEVDHEQGSEAGAGEQADADEEGTETPLVDPDKEREIWDSVREEHFEVVEQLPLTLHRQFTLLKELDQQSQGYMEDILPTLKRYIALRRDIDARYKLRHAEEQQKMSPQELETSNSKKAAEGVPMDIEPPLKPESTTIATPGSLPNAPSSGDGNHADTSTLTQATSPPIMYTTPPPTSAITTVSSHATPPPTTATTTTSSIPLPRTPIRAIPHHLSMNNITAMASPRTPTPTGVPQDRTKVPVTSREMLSHIAWASEELMRASNEKVHIAQTVHDTLERQIRALNQSIKEQELALSLGTRPGTQLAPILLPEVIVPVSRWTKRPNAMSDLDSDDEAPNGGLFDLNSEQRDGPTTLGIVPADSTPANRPQRRKGKGSNRNEPPPKLKITLPASAPELFCYCRGVSWGEKAKGSWAGLSGRDFTSESLLVTATAPSVTSKTRTLLLCNPTIAVELKFTGTLTFRWSFKWEEHEFEWKREECFLVRKPDPPVLVAITKEPPGRLKTSSIQILDYNLNRFDIEDRKGLEIVILTALLTFQDSNDAYHSSKDNSKASTPVVLTPPTALSPSPPPLPPKPDPETGVNRIAEMQAVRGELNEVTVEDEGSIDDYANYCWGLLQVSLFSVGLEDQLHQYVTTDTKPKGPKRINLDDKKANKPTYEPPESICIHLSKIPMPELQPKLKTPYPEHLVNDTSSKEKSSRKKDSKREKGSSPSGSPTTKLNKRSQSRHKSSSSPPREVHVHSHQVHPHQPSPSPSQLNNPGIYTAPPPPRPVARQTPTYATTLVPPPGALQSRPPPPLTQSSYPQPQAPPPEIPTSTRPVSGFFNLLHRH
uniref:Inhibitor of growth protein N-terminal histone-binding domain-containing protein n=1 Tax=Moniliophthora roreri TaxID=221103 RepID=A0A0W0F569_MONRR